MANRLLKTMLLLIGITLLVSCQGLGGAEPDQVSVRLKWFHQTQFAGLYTAAKEGYYTDRNLEVVLEPVDLEQQVSVEKVLSGENDFGIGSPEELILARSEGKPVKAVVVIFRLNPMVYIAPAEANIGRPQDLVGKTVALFPGQATWLYRVMMSQVEVDLSQVNEMEATAFDPYECWQTADVCAQYATNGLVQVQLDGLEPSVIWPSDYGANFYSDVIFTTDQLIENQPDLVERFVHATLQGWQAAIENPELSVEHTLAFDPDLNQEFQSASLEAAIPLIDTGQVPVGLMVPEDWERMQTILLEQELLAEPIDLSTVYTNEFVETLYE